MEDWIDTPPFDEDLDDILDALDTWTPSPTLSAGALEFEDWFRSNPEILPALIAQLRQQEVKGYPTLSVALAYEILRYESRIGLVPGCRGIRLPNQYRAFLSRIVVKAYPGLGGKLKLRQQAVEYVPCLTRLGVSQ